MNDSEAAQQVYTFTLDIREIVNIALVAVTTSQLHEAAVLLGTKLVILTFRMLYLPMQQVIFKVVQKKGYEFID